MSPRIPKRVRTIDHLLNAAECLNERLRMLYDAVPEEVWRAPSGVYTDAYRTWSTCLAAAIAAKKIASRRASRYTWVAHSPVAKKKAKRGGAA